jgi:hypothetical protein
MYYKSVETTQPSLMFVSEWSTYLESLLSLIGLPNKFKIRLYGSEQVQSLAFSISDKEYLKNFIYWFITKCSIWWTNKEVWSVYLVCSSEKKVSLH